MNQALWESDISQRLTEEEKTFITLDINGCARYIFASLISMSNR